MIIEKNVKIVVNLTSIDEKCEQYSSEEKYFPDRNNPIMNLANKIKLELKSTILQDLHEKR